jgi:hypothetical protein
MEGDDVGRARSYGAEHRERCDKRVIALDVDEIPIAASADVIDLRGKVVITRPWPCRDSQDLNPVERLLRRQASRRIRGENCDAHPVLCELARKHVDLAFYAPDVR